MPETFVCWILKVLFGFCLMSSNRKRKQFLDFDSLCRKKTEMVHHTSIENALIRFGHQMASIWFKHIFSCMTLSLASMFRFFSHLLSRIADVNRKRASRRRDSKVERTNERTNELGQIYKLRVNGWDVCWFICSLSDFMKCSALTFHRYKIIYSARVLLLEQKHFHFVLLQP